MTRQDLEHLLRLRWQQPAQAATLDAEIQAAFGVTRAVLVMDMSGFSRTTLQYGVIHFLAMIQRMNELARPAIERHGGLLVKFLADNVFAVFDSVPQALAAALALRQDLLDANADLPEGMAMFGKFGIGYGEILLIEDADIFGSEVNLASKLGENLAHANDILLTETAYAQVSAADAAQLHPRAVLISGLKLRYFHLC